MDAAFKLKHDNPKYKANIISKLFFGWIVTFFYRSTKRVLKLEDLYKTLEYDNSEFLGQKLEQKWSEINLKREKHKNYKPSLLKAIMGAFWVQYMIYGVYLFILQIALRSPQPVVLSWLIRQFQEKTVKNRTIMYALAGALVSISGLVIFFLHHINFGMCCVGMRIRIAASSLVYRKIMKLSKRSQGRTATGHVVNLLSNDVQRFDQVCMFLHYLWIMPFQVVLVTFFLWNTIGVACLAGILSMAFCTLPVQGYLGKLASSFRRKVAERTDARVKLMSEIISGIQVIKMYAWEIPFQNLITSLRMREVNVLTKTSYLRRFYLSCMVFVERTTLFLTVTCYILLGNDIRADIVFSLAQFFNILQTTMAILYPMAISLGAETLVSIKRLEEFLLLEEKQEHIVENNTYSEVIFRRVTASWVPDGDIVLNKIDLRVPKGCLCAIVGPVGSGKSSLLQVLLGELPPSRGNVSLGGNISYSSQEPWLFAASVKKNILLGRPFDPILYEKVTHVCALERDFEQFPFGDETVVGDRGVSLSGGQRARINLVRAIYKPADVYLLDDPLSAVDTHVGKHLFEKCIVKHLKGKTRILVTHQLQYLKKSDLIVVLNAGRIEAKGTFKDLFKSPLNFSKMLTSADCPGEEKEATESIEVSHGNKKKLSNLNSSDRTIQDDENEEGIGDPTNESPLWEYAKSVGNCCLVITVAFILVISQTACTGTDLWVTLWTSQEELRHLHPTQIIETSPTMEHVVVGSILNSGNSPEVLTNDSSSFYAIALNASHPTERIFESLMNHIFDTVNIDHVTHKLVKTNVAIYIYGGFIILTITLTIARSYLFFKSAMRSSKNIHCQIFHCLLETPIRFFDANPSGRILNRFSKDMGAIDEVLPRVLLESIQNSSDRTIQDDENEEGIGDPTNGSPLWEYAKSVGNCCLVITVAFILVISQTACTGTDLWVTLWTSQEELRHLHPTQIIETSPTMEHVVVGSILNSGNSPEVLTNDSSSFYAIALNASHPTERIFESLMNHIFDTVNIDHVTHKLVKTNVAIYIYGGFIILTITLTIARSYLFFKSAMRSSKNIHCQIFHCLLETPIRFFDANPSGRILNRFSKDMGAIDEVLPRVLLESIQIILVMCGILVTVIISNYYMTITTVLLGSMFLKMRTWYITSAKRIKHLEGIAKSPMFSHINSSINGLTTIRAARAENILIKEFDEHQNVHTSAWFLTIVCMVSFGLWLDIICVMFITTVTFGFVIAADCGVTVNGSLAGLAVSQSLILTGMLQYGMRQSTEVVNQLISVERVLHYTKLKGEGRFETPRGTLPDLKWPNLGKIEFRNLNLTYVDGHPSILKNLNIVIQQGEKVGIVGRTGAGKSSLISALFRLAPIDGQILIDDIDTKTIGLTDLRKNISIIPQQPVLFSATLRFNLDPFGEFADNELWAALEQVELKDLVTTLDFQVSEGGGNFSLGQRQLLCLARALLRKNKIMVLDEATANVDARTDGLIQTTIRQKYVDCTVLTIAHRLNTIMDSDKVLVMSAGEVLEFDHPFKLLEKHNGHFTKMVEEMGPSMTELLRDVALNAWKGRNKESIDDEARGDAETPKL